MRLLLSAALIASLVGCGNGKPSHYYVLCEGKDGRGWDLISSYKNEEGYLLSCTYQSPNKQQTYTASCGDDGCD